MSWLMTPPHMYRGIRARARISIRFSRGHRPTWHHPTATRCSSWGSSMDRSFKTLIGSIPTSVLSSVHPSSCDDRHLRADGNQRCPNKKKQRFKKKKKKEEEVKEKQTRKQSHLPQGGGFIISIMHSFILLPGRHRDDSSSLFGIPRFRFGVEVKLIQRPNCGSASYCVTDCCSQQ